MRTRLWIGLATATLFLFLVVFDCLHVLAAGDTPPGPDRFAVVLEKYTSYEWWLTNWTDNTVICVIDIDHEGLPTGGIFIMFAARMYTMNGLLPFLARRAARAKVTIYCLSNPSQRNAKSVYNSRHR